MWYGRHQGVDFAASQGTPLDEFVGGEVVGTGWYPWGGEVDVRIPGGVTERYLHLSSISTAPGAKLKRGQRIGLTGGGTPQSGYGYWSHGAHSHVQYDYGNINAGINPWVVWLAMKESNLSQWYGPQGPGVPGQGNTASPPLSTPTLHRMGGAGTGGALGHLMSGGIALAPTASFLAESEPEAVVPLSKLSSVLAQYRQSSASVGRSSPLAAGGAQGGVVVNVNGFSLTVNTASATMSDSEKDALASDILLVLGKAITDELGKHS